VLVNVIHSASIEFIATF